MKKAAITKSVPGSICPALFRMGLFCIFLFAGLSATAQSKWNVTIAGGLGIPFNTDNTNLNTGMGLEFGASYRFMPHLAIYTGWSWNRFPVDNQLDYDQEETGYMAGLQFRHPIATSRIEYHLKAGATYKHIETENSAGKIIGDSGHGFGWQAGGGILLPISKRLSLVPEIRYNALKRDITTSNGKSTVSLNYLSTLLGLSLSF